jgi:predicted Zn-dependent peptidase
MSSRLFQTVREEQGLAYNIHSSVSFFDDVGDMVISAGLDAEQVSATLAIIMRELRRAAVQLPSPAELRRARDYVMGQIDLSLENTESQMMNLGEQLVGHGRVIPVDEVKRHLAEVTPGQVRTLAQRCFRPERCSLALISPLRRIARLERAFGAL